MIINEWDWRYKICFDKNMKQMVMESIQVLDRKKQEIYLKIIYFYESFFSFSLILDFYEANPIECIKFIDNNKSSVYLKIIGVPQPLIAHVQNRLNLVCSDPMDKQVLDDLLKHSINSVRRVDINELFSCMFGSDYVLLKDIIHSAKPVERKENIKINPEEYEVIIERYVKNVVEDKSVASEFGEFKVSQYSTEIIEDHSGYAEWWARELTGDNHDKLIMYRNKEMLNVEDIQTTVFHEVYPGHGHYYETMRTFRPNFVDHGAMCLVEGWATYCEWNTRRSNYTKYLKNRACSILRLTSNPTLQLEDLAEMVGNLLRENNSEAQAIQSLIYLLEYPGYFESYVLGSLWLEMKISNGIYETPSQFLKYVQEHGEWGDFFSVWE
ncbi:hypothetical protein ACX1C1_07320 [Paenibacillus sp. strain BS8-2]